MHKKAHTLALALVLSGALALTGCAQSPTPSSSPSDLPTSSPTSTSTAGNGSLYSVGDDMTAKPTVQVDPAAGNVDSLLVQDVVVGTGAAAQLSDNITVHYVGIGGVSHQQFEASWDANQTASFPLTGVIAGWQQGLVGMKVGGRRLLVIPGEMAYGATPPGGSGIGVNETLIFVVDLISIP